MTREEAIETLKANYPDKCFELLRNAVDIAIKALSAEPKRWIPVEEKSPKPNEIVIISVKGEVDADWIMIDSTGHGRWYRCMKDIVDIDAWMPLPEPWCSRARKKGE